MHCHLLISFRYFVCKLAVVLEVGISVLNSVSHINGWIRATK